MKLIFGVFLSLSQTLSIVIMLLQESDTLALEQYFTYFIVEVENVMYY